MTDSNMFINQNNCLDTTPPFLSYIPAGIPIENIDIENDLRGTNRLNTRCSSKKWMSPNPDLAETVSTTALFNKNVCNTDNKILPNGYTSGAMKWDGKQFKLQ